MTNIVRWGVALALGLFLIAFGAMKFSGAHIFQFIEANAAAQNLPLQGLFHPALNSVTGAAEILAGLLIILPATRMLGGLLGLGVIGGAIVFHISPYLGINTPGGFAEGSDGAPWTLASEAAGSVVADFPPVSEYSPVLFIIALVMFAVALTNLALTRAHAKAS